MKHFLSKAAAAITVAAAMSGTASAAPCLSNPGDVVGNPGFGATVGTFIGLGINPATTCIENGLWTDPTGFSFGSYVKGAEGQGFGYDPTTLGAYNGATTGVGNANARDFYWVQDTSPNANPKGTVGSGPSQGIIWDLGGQANQVAVFVFVDHGPVPGEVLENTAWLSNDPNAADADWIQAQLVHVYGAGFSADPNIADGFVAVYQLPGLATFSHVSVTWGGPGAIVRDGDNEIDAVGGLTVAGCAVGDTRPECLTPGGTTPEPGLLALLGVGFLGLVFARKGQRKAA
jgi:hypothetical protein